MRLDPFSELGTVNDMNSELHLVAILELVRGIDRLVFPRG